MVGNIAYVVIDAYGDGSGIVAVYGPFESKEEADAWPGLPGGPQGGYHVHEMREAPEWFEGYEEEEDDSNG